MLGSGLLFLEAVPLIFSFAWLMVLCGGLLLGAARLADSSHRASRIGRWLIGSVAGIALLFYLRIALVHGTMPLFLLFLLIALAFVSAIAWWPVRKATSSLAS